MPPAPPSSRSRCPSRRALLNALMRADPDHARRLHGPVRPRRALRLRGARAERRWSRSRAARPAPWPGCGSSAADGAGAAPAHRRRGSPPSSTRAPNPAWIAAADGTLVWANARLAGGGRRRQPGRRRCRATLTFDRAADALASEAANLGERRESVRWATAAGRRRAFRVAAEPLEGGGVGVVGRRTSPKSRRLREALKRHVEAHDETLNHIADAVAIFGQAGALTFHNPAFAELWGLEPAWLAERPSHGEILDRLRQRRRLPETADYAKLEGRRARPLRGASARSPDDLWTPAGRPHAEGGAPAAPAGRPAAAVLRHHRRAEAEGPVQRPDPGAAGDARQAVRRGRRVRLRRAASAAQRGLRAASGTSPPTSSTAAGDFEGVVELCLPAAARPGLLARAEGPRRRPRSRSRARP